MFAQIESRARSRARADSASASRLSKGLVELHGGHDRSAERGLGTGSTFIVRLPLAERQRDVAARRHQQPRRRVPPALHILVADDNRDAADDLAMLLRARGS